MIKPTITLTVKTAGANNNLTIANRIVAFAYANGVSMEVKEFVKNDKPKSDFVFGINYNETQATKREWILYGSLLTRLKQLQEVAIYLDELTKDLKKPADGVDVIKGSKKPVHKKAPPVTEHFQPIADMIFQDFYPNFVLKGREVTPDLLPDWKRNGEPTALKAIIEKTKTKFLQTGHSELEWDKDTAVYAVHLVLTQAMEYPLNKFPSPETFSLTRFNLNFEQIYRYVRKKPIGEQGRGYDGIDSAVDSFVASRIKK